MAVQECAEASEPDCSRSPPVELAEAWLPAATPDKVDPYIRPLYDALFDLVDYEKVTRLLEKRVIECAACLIEAERS